jgi:uncharacterized protein (UPF0332 family)
LSVFRSVDYLDLASDLAQSAPSDPLFEAKQRSAISRAYYSVFISARNRDCSPKATHNAVFQAYIESRGRDSVSFGNRLKDLYRQRCDADYGDLVSDPDWEAQSAIEEARQLLELLSRMK